MNFENIQLVQLRQRQNGLDYRLPGAKVFDYRVENTLLQAEAGKIISQTRSNEEIWFFVYENLPLIHQSLPIKRSSKPYIVSGLIPEGYFPYSCMGRSESDPQYIAINSREDEIEKTIDKIKKIDGSQIVYGKEADIDGTIIFLKEIKIKDKQERAAEFLKLPIEEQRKRLEEIL